MAEDQGSDTADLNTEAWGPVSYFDPYFELDAVKISPGEYYVTGQEKLLVTVLGSCVSACIFDQHLGVGGMNHFMLPFDTCEPQLIHPSVRYGSHALEVVMNQLYKLGARKENLQAKVFGAGQVLANAEQHDMAVRNADFMLNYLDAEGIPVVARNLGNAWPQKIYFFPASGRVLVKKLKRLNNTTLFDREAAYVQRLMNIHVAGNVELFNR